MRIKLCFVLAGLFGVLALGFVSCKTKTDQLSNKVIRIGAISPFSGEGANYGKAAKTAIDMAVDEINIQGGVHGKKLTVIYEDDKGNPKDGLLAFQKLASVDKVQAVLGPFYSGIVLACAPEANRQRVVLLTGSATSDNITDAGEYIFRTCPKNLEQARTIADFAFNKLGLKSSFVLYRNADYGVTLRDAFVKAYKDLGGTVVGVEAVPADTTDVRAQLTKVRASSPAFIFAAVHYPEGGAILRQSKELAISSIVIGTDGGYDPQLLETSGDAADGSYWVTVGWGDPNTNPAVKKFIETYQARYDEEPGIYSGLFYDATQVLAKAINSISGQIDGPAIQKALLNTQYEGPTGLTKFDSNGDVFKPYTIYRVENGKFVPVVLKK
ncbi:MAG: penicillin-binding protein activator [Methylacidiphilales bacterium]|nr:penicillin-binding protein activator [Candidatus Methylacidiphilales bacterium]